MKQVLKLLAAACLLGAASLSQAELIDFRQPVNTEKPLESFSTATATLSSDVPLHTLSWEDTPDDYLDFARNGLYLSGQTGSFTVEFSQPVTSVGIDLFLFNNARMRSSMEPTTLTAHYIADNFSATSTIEVGKVPLTLANAFSQPIHTVVYTWNGGEITYRDFSDYLTYETGIIGVTAIQYPFTQAVPEPETYALMVSGLALLGWFARRRRKAA